MKSYLLASAVVAAALVFTPPAHAQLLGGGLGGAVGGALGGNTGGSMGGPIGPGGMINGNWDGFGSLNGSAAGEFRRLNPTKGRVMGVSKPAARGIGRVAAAKSAAQPAAQSGARQTEKSAHSLVGAGQSNANAASVDTGSLAGNANGSSSLVGSLTGTSRGTSSSRPARSGVHRGRSPASGQAQPTASSNGHAADRGGGGLDTGGEAIAGNIPSQGGSSANGQAGGQATVSRSSSVSASGSSQGNASASGSIQH
jgi:hypothetical protein